MKGLFTLASLSSLGFCFWFGKLESYQAMWAAFFAFGALLFFANIDRISEFTLGSSGFKAKTKEVAEVVEQARGAMSELQLLSKIVASTTLSLVKRSGRMGGYSDEEEEYIKGSVLNVLRQIGISEKELPDVLRDWYRFEKFDYYYYIMGGSVNVSDQLRGRVSEWTKSHQFGFKNIAKPEELMQFLQEADCYSDEAKELIEDYKYYLEFRKHRRPEVWRRRKDWSHLKKND